jgi:hypothetical protein
MGCSLALDSKAVVRTVVDMLAVLGRGAQRNGYPASDLEGLERESVARCARSSSTSKLPARWWGTKSEEVSRAKCSTGAKRYPIGRASCTHRSKVTEHRCQLLWVQSTSYALCRSVIMRLLQYSRERDHSRRNLSTVKRIQENHYNIQRAIHSSNR